MLEFLLVKIWFENSSTLDRAEHDPVLGTLSIWFHGSKTEYQYLNVPPEMIMVLAKADSPGSMFRVLIKGKFECMKIG